MNASSTTRRHGLRAAAVGVALLLVATSCGSRSKDSSDGSNGVDTTVASQTTTGGSASSTDFGTMASPCGPGDAKGATDTGVTDTSIKIGVISDKNAGTIRVPTAGIEPSMKAFVEYCNGLGGIEGRRLELKTYDAKLVNSLDSAKQACDDKLFALVGSGVVQDAPMAQPLVDCGLTSVTAYTVTYPMSASPLNVSPLPNPADEYATGAAKYVAEKYPQEIKKAAIFYPSAAASADQGKRVVQARTALGYKFIYTNTYPLLQTDWKTQVQTLKNKGVEYVTMVDTVNAAIGMLQAMKDADYHPKVIDLGQQYYDSTLAESGLADGVIVQSNTQPFETPSPAITKYLELLKQADASTPATSLGVQAFSAGLLFATAAKDLGSNLTRKGLLDKLHSIHTWDGGGLHATQDPGKGTVNTCTLLMVVKKNAFTPLYPAKGSDDPAKSFVCNPKDFTPLPGNWGTAPTLK